MIRQAIVIAALISSCSSEPKVRIVREAQPKSFEIGERAHFTFNPDGSSRLIQSGHLTIEVTGRSADMTSFAGAAALETVVGAKDYSVSGDVENAALTVDYLKGLRLSKSDTLANAHVSYDGMTDEGCDTFTLAEIRGYPQLLLTPTVCVAGHSVPAVKVTVREKGMNIEALFLADE